MNTKSFFDKNTFTITYVVWDKKTRNAIVIDPVLDYDPSSSSISYESLDKIFTFLSGSKLSVVYILETHPHADHLSGAQRIKKAFPKSTLGIHHRIIEVQKIF